MLAALLCPLPRAALAGGGAHDPPRNTAGLRRGCGLPLGAGNSSGDYAAPSTRCGSAGGGSFQGTLGQVAALALCAAVLLVGLCVLLTWGKRSETDLVDGYIAAVMSTFNVMLFIALMGGTLLADGFAAPATDVAGRDEGGDELTFVLQAAVAGLLLALNQRSSGDSLAGRTGAAKE